MQVNDNGEYEGIISGKKVCYPRVTKIIGEFLENWDAVPSDILEKAANFGQAVHAATEYDDQKILKISKISPRIWPCLKAWRKFKIDFDITFEEIEPIVYSTNYKYAGRIDRIGFVKGIRSVIDIKTCKYKPLTHDLQVAAYFGAWNEMEPKKKCRKRYLVELKMNSEYRLHELKGGSDYAVFLSAVALYHWKKNK